MAPFVRSKEAFLRRFMKLEHGIAGRDALSRLSRGLDPEGQRQALAPFAADRAGRLRPDVALVDGKTLRRSFEGASKRSPLHVVNAFARRRASGARPGPDGWKVQRDRGDVGTAGAS